MSIEKLIIMPGIYQVPFFLESSVFYIFNPHGVENKWPYFLLCCFEDLGIPELTNLFMLITYPYQKFTFPGFYRNRDFSFLFLSAIPENSLLMEAGVIH